MKTNSAVYSETTPCGAALSRPDITDGAQDCSSIIRLCCFAELRGVPDTGRVNYGDKILHAAVG